MSGTLRAQRFLHRFLPLLGTERIRFTPRTWKTKAFMLEYGLTVADVYEIIKKLKAEEYRKGPEPDYNGTPGSVMVFHHPWKGILLYVKLKLDNDGTADIGEIMSTHQEGMH